MGRRITALEVAKEAGVSRSAVSLVLNGRADGFLAKDTQERIREVADRLGYRPNLLAQSLRNQRSKVIGIMSDRAVGGAFDGAIIAGADAVAREAGFMTLATDTGGEPEKAEPVARLLLDRAVEGLIYLTVGLHGTRVLDSFLRVPAALANCYPTADSPAAASLLPVFIPDEPTGGRVAAEHLIALGHRRIAFLRGDDDSPASFLREDAFRAAMGNAGLPVREEWVRHGGFLTRPAYAAATAVLEGPADRRPTAILAGNDRAAVGVVLAAANLGISVPADLSVVGYDDEAALADLMVPALTTVALPLQEMGRRAMASVLARLEPEAAPAPTSPPAQVLLPCPLVERESTAPPPA